MLGPNPQAPNMATPLKVTPNDSLGSAQAGLLQGKIESLSWDRQELTLRVLRKTANGFPSAGKNPFAFLPLPDGVNGAPSFLSAHTCNLPYHHLNF